MPLPINSFTEAVEEYRTLSGKPEASFIDLVVAMGYTRQTGYDWRHTGLSNSRINEITGFLTRLEEGNE